MKTPTKNSEVNIGKIAKVQFGFYAKSADEGDVPYLQGKHFNEWDNELSEVDTFINMNSKSESHLLQDGDILLAGKGFRNFAWTYRNHHGPVVASSMFFVIRPDQGKVLPEFLTIFFNTPSTQSFFKSLGAGTNIPSIRKSELQALELNLPNFEQQQKVVSIQQLHKRENEILRELINEKEKIYQALIKKIIE
ncbi:MAG: restriction endonuclease subunit S [Bacteroidia bacterium]